MSAPTPGPGRMDDNEWPAGVPFPSFGKPRYPKTPKEPKPPKDLHGSSCSRSLPAAVFLTVTEMFLHWRELPDLLRETETYR